MLRWRKPEENEINAAMHNVHRNTRKCTVPRIIVTSFTLDRCNNPIPTYNPYHVAPGWLSLHGCCGSRLCATYSQKDKCWRKSKIPPFVSHARGNIIIPVIAVITDGQIDKLSSIRKQMLQVLHLIYLPYDSTICSIFYHVIKFNLSNSICHSYLFQH